MSAALSLGAGDLRDLAAFLEAITEATRNGGVRLAVYGRTEVAVGDVAISISWDAEHERYVLDDRVGG